MSSNYYGILGLTHTATSDEIKKQYKKLAIKYHPDKTQDKDHHQKFLLIREAYDTLKDDESRQKYNRENGIGVTSRPASGFSSSRGYNHGTDYPSFSRHQQTRTSYTASGFGTNFFDMYQRSSKMYSDHFSRTAQREAARKKEEQDAFYAEYTRKKMQEDNERRRQEYITRARKQKEEEELRQKMEESMRRQKEEKMGVKDEYPKSRGFGDAKNEYEHAKMEAHRRARQAESHGVYGYTGFPHHEEKSAEFIVVEDEEPEMESGSEGISGESHDESDNSENFQSGYESASHFEDVKNEANSRFHTTGNSHSHAFEEEEDKSDTMANSDHEHDEVPINGHEEIFEDELEEDLEEESEEEEEVEDDDEEEEEEEDGSPEIDQETVPPTEAANDYTNASFTSEGTEYATPGASRNKPEIVEVPEESDHDATSNYFQESVRSKTPSSRPHSEARFYSSENDFDERLKNSHIGAKKPRLANYDGMRSSLHTYFEDVDFSDIRDTLPNYTNRARKASSSNSAQTSKRPRYAEYTNETSKAETLYTPVNKTYSRKSTGTISMTDLSPNVEETSLLFSEDLPSLTVHEGMTKAEWDAYVEKIHAYERKFAAYRKAVLEYQMGRLEKDERHHNIIYSDTSCIDVYSKCIFSDALLLQNYNRALQEFRQTLISFKLNCEMVDKMKA